MVSKIYGEVKQGIGKNSVRLALINIPSFLMGKMLRMLGKVMAVFSGLIIFIACLGLFGLSSYTITQRTKEIGIRKVLGSSVIGIVRLLTFDFTKTILIAALLALPIAYLLMEEWLSSYAVRISLNAWIFILAVIVILLIAIITVSFQTIRTAVANPVNSLRQE